ncbi:MAG TPA: glycosyltransferase [Polyangiaceae bacterium]|nr:glycosyltransferase [Polyangiaceae bacterium]
MSALTVVHVLSSFGVGGQERMALELASWQKRRGHRVLAVSLAPDGEGPLGELFRAAGIEAETVPKHAGVDASLPVRLATVLGGAGADIAHTHNPHAMIYGAPAAGLARCKSVHTKHGMNPDQTRRLWLRRTAATLVDAYVAVTPLLAQVAAERAECDPSRIHVVPNGIDVTRFKPDPEARARVRAELGIPSGAWLVGTVGRLAPEKDQALLIRAMAPLLDERRQLVVVGDGPERAALERARAETWRAEFVHLIGARSDVAPYLAAMDAFVLSSRTEGLPLVLLEAMATGVPVVSTAVGGIPDLVESGVNGMLVPPEDERGLVRELVSLANQPTAGLKLGQAGREAVLRRYSLAQMAERYEEIYQQVTSGVQRKPRLAVAAAGA